MKKITVLTVMMLFLGSFFILSPTPAEATDVENLPIIGAIVGAVEIVYSTGKNIANCSGVVDCINVPKQIGKGVINGTERILGTTVNLVAPETYERKFAENSQLANNKILSNTVGWAGTGYVAASLGMTNAIFGIDQSHNALMVTGAVAGTGTAATDIAVSDGEIND